MDDETLSIGGESPGCGLAYWVARLTHATTGVAVGVGAVFVVLVVLAVRG